MEYGPKEEREQDRRQLDQMVQQGKQDLGGDYPRSGLGFMHDQNYGLLEAEELNARIHGDQL